LATSLTAKPCERIKSDLDFDGIDPKRKHNMNWARGLGEPSRSTSALWSQPRQRSQWRLIGTLPS